MIALTLLLTACPGAEVRSCSSVPVSHPWGKCSAYYYQADFGDGGKTTQALVDCEIDAERLGGNVVSLHALEHGIGLRWLNATTLEVSVPEGGSLEGKRSGDTYRGHALTYVYRTLPLDSPDFAGCL